jgi:alkylated DNA repair protein (DNA oxidative demethylase)
MVVRAYQARVIKPMSKPSQPFTTMEGLRFHPGFFSAAEQRILIAEVLSASREAPFYTPVMPRSGRPFSVRMTNLGRLGWVSDRAGYRYQAMHPETLQPWPAMPEMLVSLWQAVSGYPHPAEACLVNLYREGAKMGLHRDEDEEEFAAPVVSVSLGDTAIFRIGGLARSGKTLTLKLSSGDVVVMGGPSRLIYHGIDRVLGGSSTLVPGGGRINLTLRRVSKPGTQS